MSTSPGRAPGYYPDPEANNAIRYWDGRQWSQDHRGAAPRTDPSTSAPPYGTPSGYGAPSPYGAASPYGSPTSATPVPAAPYGTPPPGGAGWTSPQGPPSPGPNPYAPGYAGGSLPPGAPPMVGLGRPNRRRRSLLIPLAASIVAVAVIAVVVVVAVRVTGRPPEPTGTVTVGQPSRGDVPDGGGSWASSVTVSTAGAYVVQATGSSDLTLELYDDDGSISDNDDAGGLLADSTLDPAILVHLEPGEYVVEVDTYDDDRASATLEVSAATDAVQLTEGVSEPIAIPVDGYWIGYLTVADARELSVDVQAVDPDDDLTMLVGWRGETDDYDDRESGDPGGASYDPYVETGDTDYVVVLVGLRWSYSDVPTDAVVTVG